MRALPFALVSSVLIVACGGDPIGPDDDPGGLISCDGPASSGLAIGASAILDATSAGSCVRFPATASSASEHLYVALSGAGNETANGVEADYELEGTGEGMTAAARALALSPALSAFQPQRSAEEFHRLLRMQERAISALPGGALFDRQRTFATAAVPPTVGHERTFKVCSTPECTGFTDVVAEAAVVGEKVAIYLDKTVPDGGYSDADLASVGQLFDDFLYPIDTVAFGRESDIDNNGVVVVLLTDAVNALSGGCSDGSVIVGYFFGLDLQPSLPNSNQGEIFYSVVPDPESTGECGLTRDRVNEILPTAFIHEFQHMISYAQHVLVRSGIAEDTWLNEGLSHYAEELGARKIPDERCAPDGSGQPSCLVQFAFGNLRNAYDYLLDPEQHYLVEPGTSSGTLEERGANWLFVRWLVDHFRVDEHGANVTRALVQTDRTGGDNVAAVTSVPFATLAGEWHLANYLDDLPGFTAQNTRLRYDSWNFRSTFANLHQQLPGLFPLEYPLVPDVAINGDYQRLGTLLGGSGHHVRVTQPADAGPVSLRLTDPAGLNLPPTVVPRVAVVRIR